MQLHLNIKTILFSICCSFGRSVKDMVDLKQGKPYFKIMTKDYSFNYKIVQLYNYNSNYFIDTNSRVGVQKKKVVRWLPDGLGGFCVVLLSA